MNIQSYFKAKNGVRYPFRRKHTRESFAGKSGIFALTAVQNFEVHALYFEAANDLSCVDAPALRTHPEFERLQGRGRLGVAICVMNGTSADFRASVAAALNDAIDNAA